MTREEAVEVLKERYLTCVGIGWDNHANRVNEAIDMAIEALSAEHKHCWDCKHYEPKYNVCHAPEVVKQVTSKLNNPCDSLLTDESNGSKEHKSKLDLISRVDAIDALCRSSVYAWSIEQDQTAHNWALNIIKALPSAEAEEYDDYEHATLVDIKEPLKVAVVRCKDCEHWDTADGECYGLDGVHYSKADDFCSHGERKEP